LNQGSNAANEELINMCRDIHDMAYTKFLVWSSTSRVWKIAGHLGLPFFWSSDRKEFKNKFGVVELSWSTGFTIGMTLQILRDNQEFFAVTAFSDLESDDVPRYEVYLSVRPELQLFLETESRSQDLHFAYRHTVMMELNFKISYGLNVSKSFVIFQLYL